MFIHPTFFRFHQRALNLSWNPNNSASVFIQPVFYWSLGFSFWWFSEWENWLITVGGCRDASIPQFPHVSTWQQKGSTLLFEANKPRLTDTKKGQADIYPQFTLASLPTSPEYLPLCQCIFTPPTKLLWPHIFCNCGIWQSCFSCRSRSYQENFLHFHSKSHFEVNHSHSPTPVAHRGYIPFSHILELGAPFTC